MCYNGDMRRKWIAFGCVVTLFFCQCPIKVMALTESQSAVVVERCSAIKEELKKIQKEDARVRVYLGGYYETILTKFITPLNMRLVENNLSSAGLVENQNSYVETRALFMNDFVTYQQGLEELVGMDCKERPDEFYDKLQLVQKKRKIMSQDILKMRSLISENMKLVNSLKEKL